MQLKYKFQFPACDFFSFLLVDLCEKWSIQIGCCAKKSQWFIFENAIMKKVYNFSYWCVKKKISQTNATIQLVIPVRIKKIEWYSNEFQLKQFHCYIHFNGVDLYEVRGTEEESGRVRRERCSKHLSSLVEVIWASWVYDFLEKSFR